MATAMQEGATALFPFNSYSEILLNPEKDAVNREAVGPLNCAARREPPVSGTCQAPGLPGNLSPHTGWVGPQAAAGPSPCPHVKAAGRLVREFVINDQALCRETGVPSCLRAWPQDGREWGPQYREAGEGG